MAPRSASEKVRPKKSYFSSACEYVKLSFSLRVPKKEIFRQPSNKSDFPFKPIMYTSIQKKKRTRIEDYCKWG
jgi:hypothetical protein